MKISIIDRTQAIKRSKIYKQDYADYMKTIDYEQDAHVGSKDCPSNYHVRLSRVGKKLCEKWDLVFPVNPHLPEEQNDLNAVIALLDPPEKWEMTKSNVVGNQKQITHVNGKLVIMIDKNFTHKQIEEAFKKHIKYWIKEGCERERENALDIWEIYDAHHCDEKSLFEVTRDTFNIEATKDNLPAANDNVKAQYAQVQRHYDKACKIIDYIEQQALKTPL